MSRRIFLRLLVVVTVVAALFVWVGGLSAQGNSGNAFDHVREVQQRHTAKLMAQKGVVGTAVGLSDSGRPAMLVLLEEQGVPGIPAELEGVSVRSIVTGKIDALAPRKATPKKNTPQKKIDTKDRFERPVPIGVSTGNRGECSAGTIGCRVKKGSAVYALSNNHVYALENEAAIGSNVVQPGLYDTRCVYDADNVIGDLADFVSIEFSTTASNRVDAAIASTTTDECGNATPADGYGTPSSTTTSAVIGTAVQKYGRTTGLTKGTIAAIYAEINIGYSAGTARFVDQIIVTSRSPFIKAGDSGSLLVTDPDRNPVGLLFAGDSSGKFAIANQIGDVLDALGGVGIDGE